MDAALAEVTRSALKLSGNLASFFAVLLAAMAIATLAVASVATVRATRTAFTEFKMLSASQSEAIRIESDLIDEETGIRGYAATGERSLLEPFTNAARRMPAHFKNLRNHLTLAHRTDLLVDVAQLQSIQALWNRDVAQTTLRARDPRSTIPAQLRGKGLIDRSRAVSSDIQRALRAQLGRVFDDMTSSVRTVTLFSAMLIALVGVIVAFASLAARRIRKRTRSEAELRSMIEAMPQIVFVTDAEGQAIFFNQRCYDYTGLRESQSLGTGWTDAIHPDDLPKTTALWESSVRTGMPYEVDYRLRNANGQYQWFVGRALPQYDKRGRIIRWLGTCTDVDAQHAQLESFQRVADAFSQAQLPENLPSTSRVFFDATYLPAEDLAQVGGDWYDAFALGNDRFFFSLGDVTGHGLDAAVTMSRVRQAILSFASVENDPATILERANTVLRMHRETMVTALCGTFDARSGALQYASAGHPPSLLVREDATIHELSSGAPPLGILDRISVQLVRDYLNCGDRLVCYTDGVTENERDVLRGESRLRQALAALTPFEAAEPARAIRERILGGRRGRDDVAILVLSRLDPAGVALAAESGGSAWGKG